VAVSSSEKPSKCWAFFLSACGPHLYGDREPQAQVKRRTRSNVFLHSIVNLAQLNRVEEKNHAYLVARRVVRNGVIARLKRVGDVDEQLARL
jgi:hypothetical protein